MGYPNRETLRQWSRELAPDRRKKRRGGLQYTEEQKREAVAALCTRKGRAREVARNHGVSRQALYQWKNDLLGREVRTAMTDTGDDVIRKTKEELLEEIERLQNQIKRLKLERDVLEVTAEIIKKDPGVDPKNLANREKALLVDALRTNHLLKDLLHCVKMSRSSYFYQHARLSAEDKYGELKARVRVLFEENGGRYGYRRIHALLLREGKRISEKIVRRIMTESALVVFGRKKRKIQLVSGRERAVGEEPAQA